MRMWTLICLALSKGKCLQAGYKPKAASAALFVACPCLLALASTPLVVLQRARLLVLEPLGSLTGRLCLPWLR